MLRLKFVFIILLSLALTTSCGQPNVLTEFSKTDSDEALYVEAKKQLDLYEWQGAIDIIEDEMSAGFRARMDVVETLASAYAGKCGLIFFDLVQGLSNNPSTALFPYFMDIFKNQTLDTPSCDEAIELIEGLGTVTTRTQDQNLFMALLGIARLGTTLSSKLDQDDHNGVADAPFNMCHDYSGGGPADVWPAPYNAPPFTDPPFSIPQPPPTMDHYLSDTDVTQVITGLGLVFENLAALGAAIGGVSTIDALEEALEDCEDVNGGSGSCTITDPANVTAETRYAFRLLLDDGDMGFGSCSMAAFGTYDPDADDDGVVDTAPPANLCCLTRPFPGIEL